MNKFLSLLGLFVASSAFAQLTVKQDGSTETYIYVTDQVLYVADDISVTKAAGATADTKAGIYLRDDAQLIQGASQSTANDGTGFISVYQDSNSDSYDYNYWASPVSNAGSNLFTLAGSVYDATDTLAARSVVFQNVGFHNGQGRSGLDYSVDTQLKISPTWLYSFNAATQNWQYIGASSQSLPSGKGFIMKGTNETTGGSYNVDPNNQYYEFRGRANSGNIEVTLGATENSMALAGNPYPSAIDLTAFFNDVDNNGVAAIMYWDEDRTVNSHYYVDNKGGYGTWIPGASGLGEYVVPTFMNYENGGVATTSTGTYGEDITRRYAPIGQGFMLKRILVDPNTGASTNDVATFKNEHRTFIQEGEQSIFRNPENRSHTRFHVIFDDYSHYRDLLLTYHERSTLGFDRGADAPHPMDAGQKEAYFNIQDDSNGMGQKNLAIQSVPFSMNMSIPIAFKLDQQGRVRIKAAEELNVPYYKVLLLDTQDNMRYPILGESNTIGNGLTVQLTLPAGTYEDRFFIVFEDAPEEDPGHPDTRSALADSFDFVQDNRAKQLEVANPEMHKVDEVNIYDMSGKLVYYAYGLGSASRYSFPTYNFADGVYMVRLVTENDGVVSYKMSVINR
jgi:hypothetical protein